jgi:SNF2 family DNA or RNA helicase
VTSLAIEPARTLPNGRLYYSPWGLLPFQEIGVATVAVRTEDPCLGQIAIWDTGLGKTHLMMATVALLFELGLIDQAVVCCERTKVKDWIDDFEKFTALRVGMFYGPKRKRLYTDMPPVIVTVYETMRVEVAGPKGKRTGPGGPLTEMFRHKRVLLGYDEVSKLGGRRSALYKAHEFFINAVRKDGHLRVLGLTATPTEKGDTEGYFNIARLLAPNLAPTVAEFEAEHVKYRDIYGRPVYRKWTLPDFRQRIAPAILRKRKTDSDVIDQFPKQVEEATHVEMGDAQKAFYRAVECIYDPPEGEPDRRTEEQMAADDRKLFMVLRLIAAHPLSLSRTKIPLAKQITEKIGIEGLRAIGSAKTEELIKRLRKLCDQDSQVVLFTFFAESVLPILLEEIRNAGFTVVEHHGGMTPVAQYRAQDAFKKGEVQIFLTSDAGARGLNFGQAAYVENYEATPIHDTYIQRMNRVNRLDSIHPSVTSNVFILDGTVEERMARSALRRNEEAELVIEDDIADENYVSAEMRKELLGYRRR